MDSDPGRPTDDAPGGNPPPTAAGDQPPTTHGSQSPHPQQQHPEPLHPQQPGPYGAQQPGPYPPQQYPPQQYPPQQYPPQQFAQAQHGPYQQQPGAYPQQFGAAPGAVQPHPQQYAGMQPGPLPPWVQPPEPQVLPVPPETPYHRMARNAKHSWWRPIVGTVVVALGAIFLTVGLYIPWAFVHVVITGDDSFMAAPGDDLFPNVNEEIAFALASIGSLTLLVLFTVRIVQRRPAWSIASVIGRIRWRWLLLCCGPAFAYLAVSYLLGGLVEVFFPSADTATDEGSWVGFGAFIVPALIIICLVPFQSAAEEFVFRGWVIQAVGAYGPDQVEGRAQWFKRLLRTPWPGIVVTSILFVSVHGYTDWALADIFLFAMVVGWLTVHTGGLEAAIALHVLNNLAAFLLPAATGQLEGWDVQGSAPWTTLLVDIPAFAAFGVLVVWLARRKQIARVSPAATTDPAPSGLSA